VVVRLVASCCGSWGILHHVYDVIWGGAATDENRASTLGMADEGGV
jgi:hypothetical protein